MEKRVTKEEFEQEVCFYRQAIVEAIVRIDPLDSWDDKVPEVLLRFKGLARDDLAHFRKLCARLLDDEQQAVRLGTMKLIGLTNIRDNTLSILLVESAMKQEDLREEALNTLWHVGTRLVLPQLLLFAEKGYSTALYIVRHMIRTPEEIERGIAIARKYIDAQDYELREAALFLLQKYSSMEQEAKGVLAAVQKYTDELFIDALKEAPPELVLEPLKELRATIGEEYGEYRDLSSTIRVLEQKSKTDEQEGEINDTDMAQD